MCPELGQRLVVSGQLIVNVGQIESDFYVHIRKSSGHLTDVFKNHMMTLYGIIEGTGQKADKKNLQKEIKRYTDQ
jgi:hypothetical protein